jgi:hypothetical protein
VVSGRSFRDLSDCQRAFDAWRGRNNHERPHEALGLARPAERCRPSARAFPEALPPIDYAPGDQVRKVRRGRLHQLQEPALAHQQGVARSAGRPSRLEDKDGVFAIYFCAHRIGALDLRERQTEAWGLVDDAARRPQGPQQEQQPPVSI